MLCYLFIHMHSKVHDAFQWNKESDRVGSPVTSFDNGHQVTLEIEHRAPAAAVMNFHVYLP